MYRPDTVINCAGVVKGRQVTASEYMRVNGLGPHILAEECADQGIQLIQVSTDCVFSGRNGPYTENDLPDPSDLYGRSKLAGEVYGSLHLTVRTSFIGYGQHGLLAWAMRQKGTVPGFEESYWNGLTALQLARTLVQLAEMAATGLYHVGTDVGISKCELLKLFKEFFELPINVVTVMTPPEHRVNRILETIHIMPLVIPTIEEMLVELSMLGPAQVRM